MSVCEGWVGSRQHACLQIIHVCMYVCTYVLLVCCRILHAALFVGSGNFDNSNFWQPNLIKIFCWF